jgi:hypothetical protein
MMVARLKSILATLALAEAPSYPLAKGVPTNCGAYGSTFLPGAMSHQRSESSLCKIETIPSRANHHFTRRRI